jgi:hypothetical protein
VKVQYLGDVNDYRKYALLRLLAGAGFKIGVNWMLTPNDNRADGQLRRYLVQRDEWRQHDMALFDFLATIPRNPSTDDFKRLEQSNVVPGAAYFNQLVPVGTGLRGLHHAACMEHLADSDLIFFDPDNGLAIPSTSKSRQDGVKFVFDDELEDHYHAGRSLLIYQHFPRQERTQVIRAQAERLNRSASGAPIWACRTANVLFLLVANPMNPVGHDRRISKAVALAATMWSEAFIAFQPITIATSRP